jgi:DNA-binding XRE family transcriptional regulator
MDINKVIESRRKELGLSEQQVADSIGVNLDSYCDIEWHEYELRKAVELRKIRLLSRTLGLGMFELLSMECAFCDGRTAYLHEYRLPRHELIKILREKEGLSQYELAERSDYYEEGIQAMERDSDYFERSRVEDVQDLVASLKAPLQILLGVKCPKCGR